MLLIFETTCFVLFFALFASICVHKGRRFERETSIQAWPGAFPLVQLKIYVKMKSRAGHWFRLHMTIKEWLNLNLASIKQLLFE